MKPVLKLVQRDAAKYQAYRTEGLVDPFTSHANEATTDWHISCHLGHGVIHEPHYTAISGIGEQHAKGTALIESTTNADEQRCANGTTDSNELNLAVPKMTLEVIGVISHRTVLDIIVIVVCLADELAGVLLLLDSHGCKGFVAQAVLLGKKVA
jgi:hypothetical protein